MAGEVVGIHITLAVPLLCHQFGGCIAQMEGHRQIARLTHLLQSRIDGEIGGVALGRRGKIDAGFGQGDASFGPPDLLHGIEGSIGQKECIGIGQTDVFACRNDQTTGDEDGVLPSFDHAGHIVDGSIGIGAPD